MSDEIKITEEHEHKCLCQNKMFRKFLTIALGTFVGVYCALCLFTAIHKPPMMVPNAYGPMPMVQPCPCMMMGHRMKHDGERRFERQIPQENRTPAPFEVKRSEVND